jgi:hypothetical protein
MKIGDKVKIIKDCGHKGDIGTIVGKEKVQLTIVTPTGYMWRVAYDNNMPDSLFLTEDLKIVT